MLLLFITVFGGGGGGGHRGDADAAGGGGGATGISVVISAHFQLVSGASSSVSKQYTPTISLIEP